MLGGMRGTKWEAIILVLPSSAKYAPRTDAISHNCAIKACDIVAKWPHALALLAGLPKEVLADAVTYSATISACQKSSKWQSVFSILDIERGWRPVGTTCNSVLAGCANAARWREAVSFFTDIVSARLQPDVVSYNCKITAYENALEWQKPLLLLSEIFVRRLQPTTISYNSVISACDGLGEWMQAMRMIRSASGQTVESNLITYSAAMSTFATAKRWLEATFLLDTCEMLDVIACNVFLNACEKAGQWMLSLALLSELHEGEKGFLSDSMDAVSYNSTISACGQAAQWEQALFLLSNMLSQTLQPSLITYNSTFAALASADSELHTAKPKSGKASLWQQVLELLLQIRINRLHANMLTCNSAIRVCHASGQHLFTVSLLGQVRTAMLGEIELNNRFPLILKTPRP